MALVTADPALHRRSCHGHARDPVFRGGMTVLAAHVHAPHVQIDRGVGFRQTWLQIAVFGIGRAATVEVTGTAGLTRWTAYLLRDRYQVQRWIRETAFLRILLVRARCVMADQAVDVGRILEIVAVIYAAVSDVA